MFDAHADTLTALARADGDLFENDGHFDLQRALRYQPCAQFFAVYAMDFDEAYLFFERMAQKYSRCMTPCLTGADARTAAREGKLAAFLSLEGADTVRCSRARLEDAYGKGVRMVALTWNHDNALAGGVGGSGGGLTEEGQRFLESMLSLGILPDVSHLSDGSFWDVAEYAAGRPFVASHSNARAVCAHRRNLTDEQFLAIARVGGFVGLNLYSDFLSARPAATLEDVLAHIEHFASLGGVGCIGLGADMDGCESLPETIGGIQDVGNLYELLLRKNYPEDMVRGIFYNNILRVVESICDM